MKIIDIVNGPWAITLQMHREIGRIYTERLAGERPDFKSLGIEIQKRDPLQSAAIVAAAASAQQVENRGTYTVIDGVAVIPVQDVIAKRMTCMMEICGGCSSQILAQDFAEAQADPAVKGILLYVDSPGGTVDGTMEAAGIIAASRGNKPCIAFTDGMICSAAYWISAAADEIYISSDTNPIGSIGVVAAHVDVSKRMEMFGQRVTEITAGDYKRIASNYSPLTDEGRGYIQAQLDHIYTAFTDQVGSWRGLSVDDHKDWADGQIFLGSQAIDSGLVDGMSTMGELIQRLSSGSSPAKRSTRPKQAAAGAVGATNATEENSMDLATLRKDHAALVASIEEGARQGYVSQADVDKKLGEQRTAAGALVAALCGEEAGAKFVQCQEAGLSAEQVKALGITVAAGSDTDMASRQAILDGLEANGNKALKTVVTESNKKGGDKEGEDFQSLLAAYRKENPDANAADAMKAVVAAHPEAHEAYIAKANEGRK